MRLLTEAFRSAFAQPVASIVTAVIVAGVCTAILLTTGQTVRAEQGVLSQIDAADTRSVTITDTQGTAEITAAAVDRICRLSGVEWVIGLGRIEDARAIGNLEGKPVPVVPVYGSFPPQIDTRSAEIRSDEALVGTDAQQVLGLQVPVGAVATNAMDIPVGGSFLASEPLRFLNRSLIVGVDSSTAEIRRIHILVASPADVARVADAALTLAAAQDERSVAVTTAETLVEVRAAVQGELGSYGRNVISLVLSAGLLLAGLNAYGSVNNRRRDFGRRRALGASRGSIVRIVAYQTAVPAMTGALVGTISTEVGLALTSAGTIDARFASAIVILATLATTLASVPSSVLAAFRDPVRVLRVP